MKERATTSRSVDEIYEAFHGAAVRFGESKIKSRRMSNGRVIYFPASWDKEPKHRTGREERERRLAELERLL
jgi:hypothetical protein